MMSNEDTSVVAFNKEKWNIADARKKAKEELLQHGFGDDEDSEMRMFEGYVSYGFYTNFDGEQYNGWNINLNRTVQDSPKKRGDVEVWVFELVYKY